MVRRMGDCLVGRGEQMLRYIRCKFRIIGGAAQKNSIAQQRRFQNINLCCVLSVNYLLSMRKLVSLAIRPADCQGEGWLGVAVGECKSVCGCWWLVPRLHLAKSI